MAFKRSTSEVWSSPPPPGRRGGPRTRDVSFKCKQAGAVRLRVVRSIAWDDTRAGAWSPKDAEQGGSANSVAVVGSWPSSKSGTGTGARIAEVIGGYLRQ